MNKLRQKLEQGEKVCGTLVCLTDPGLCEVFGHMGYDCIWIDMEHTYVSYKDVLCHLNAARSTGTPALVRLPQNDLTATKKIMEMGPEAVLFPMVHGARETKELLDMTLYPPHGTRGFGPMRAIRYDAGQSDAYAREESLEMCRFIQVEHVDCVKEIEEVVKHPFLDGVIFGPNDLSRSMGLLGDAYAPEVVDVMNRVIEVLRKNGKYIGIAGGFAPEVIKFWSEFDVDMIFAGADWNFVHAQGLKTLKDLRNIYQNKVVK